MDKQSRYALQMGLGFLILIILFKTINGGEVRATLSNANFYFLFISLAIYLSTNLLMSWRIKYLLHRAHNHTPNYGKVFSAHMGGMLLGEITPGKVGYFAVPYFLRKKGSCSLSEGMSSILAPQGIDFILKVVLVFASIIYLTTFVNIPYIEGFYLGVGASILLAVSISLLILTWVDESYSGKIIAKIPFLNRFRGQIDSLKRSGIKTRKHFKIVIITALLGWVLSSAQWFFIGKAIGIELPIILYFLIQPLMTAIMFIPLTPAGIGIAEGSGIGILALFGVSAGVGISFLLLIRALNIGVNLIGLNSITKKPEVVQKTQI
jgi:uncharacterized protein (TIRG00374 family)